MVRKEVEQDGALFVVLELLCARKAGLVLLFVGREFRGATGLVRRTITTALRRIDDERLRSVGELLLERIGKKDALGELAD